VNYSAISPAAFSVSCFVSRSIRSVTKAIPTAQCHCFDYRRRIISIQLHVKPSCTNVNVSFFAVSVGVFVISGVVGCARFGFIVLDETD